MTKYDVGCRRVSTLFKVAFRRLRYKVAMSLSLTWGYIVNFKKAWATM